MLDLISEFTNYIMLLIQIEFSAVYKYMIRITSLSIKIIDRGVI